MREGLIRALPHARSLLLIHHHHHHHHRHHRRSFVWGDLTILECLRVGTAPLPAQPTCWDRAAGTGSCAPGGILRPRWDAVLRVRCCVPGGMLHPGSDAAPLVGCCALGWMLRPGGMLCPGGMLRPRPCPQHRAPPALATTAGLSLSLPRLSGPETSLIYWFPFFSPPSI